MFEIDPPSDKPSIAATLERLEREIGDYFAALPPAELLAPQGEAWSPCGHLRHLVRSAVPVARAMRWPRPLLRLLFGRARGGSRDYETMRERYHEALAGGLRAGSYGPPSGPDPLPPAARRGRTLGNWRRACGQLRAALERWPEADLDRCRLPHPALGRLTVREMLFFTLYHFAHHARRVDERRASPAGR